MLPLANPRNDRPEDGMGSSSSTQSCPRIISIRIDDPWHNVVRNLPQGAYLYILIVYKSSSWFISHSRSDDMVSISTPSNRACCNCSRLDIIPTLIAQWKKKAKLLLSKNNICWSKSKLSHDLFFSKFWSTQVLWSSVFDGMNVKKLSQKMILPRGFAAPYKEV